MLLAVGFFLAGLPIYADQLRAVCQGGDCLLGRQLGPAEAQALVGLGLSLDHYAMYQAVLATAWTGGSVAVAALIGWRVRTGIGLFVALTLALMAAMTFSTTPRVLAATHPIWSGPVAAFNGLALLCFLTVFYVFPDGRFVPRWTRLMPLPVAAYVLWVLLTPLVPGTAAAVISPLLGVTALGLSVGSQVYRYRRVSGPTARQQTKWVLAGCVGQLVGAVIVALPAVAPLEPGLARLVYTLFSFAAITLLVLFFPVSFAIAIFRYRLWEIDLIINRALVYGLLTGSLLAVYLGSVVLLQDLFRSLTGQESNLAIVVATLAAAALFQPLRRRLQAFIDRRFYRRKYDAAHVLAAFSASLRDEVDLARLSEDLLAVLEDTLQPSHVSLWLGPLPGGRSRARQE
jgi:hypothetical protein